MANMGKVTKRLLSARLDIALCVGIEKKYRREGDISKVTAYIRALEDASRDVILTPEDYDKIASEIRENMLKRKRGK